MEVRWMPLILGGLAPAVLYGVAGVMQKWSARVGGTVSMYLIGFGLATFMVGWLFRWLLADPAASADSFYFALAGGAAFAVGAGLISLALIRFDAAISQLSPLYNSNVLITVVLGLVIFAESEQLHLNRLAIGTVLIVLGALFVARA